MKNWNYLTNNPSFSCSPVEKGENTKVLHFFVFFLFSSLILNLWTEYFFFFLLFFMNGVSERRKISKDHVSTKQQNKTIEVFLLAVLLNRIVIISTPFSELKYGIGRALLIISA